MDNKGTRVNPSEYIFFLFFLKNNLLLSFSSAQVSVGLSEVPFYVNTRKILCALKVKISSALSKSKKEMSVTGHLALIVL